MKKNPKKTKEVFQIKWNRAGTVFRFRSANRRRSCDLKGGTVPENIEKKAAERFSGRSRLARGAQGAPWADLAY